MMGLRLYQIATALGTIILPSVCFGQHALDMASRLYGAEVDALRAAVVKINQAQGAALVADAESAATLLLSWLAYLREWRLTTVADELIAGTQAAIIEAAGCVCLGLVRPALFSMRAQIDMLLSWLFFRDHKVEWERVQLEGEGFKLRKEATGYLEQHIAGFRERFALLGKRKRRTSDDVYRLLSAHVHSQSAQTVPNIADLRSLVRSKAVCHECVKIQGEVSEYLSDVLVAAMPEVWPDLPAPITADLQGRLTTTERSKLFNQPHR